ncbi:polysaccharide pyruvyl transferase family protein [Gillisia hiemivivida]|uniref:Polysaccharide pyruvyl transferase family protein n=1 Tax=Gillisia hiemivivida TaxID=291190 RepID=A0A5C6ZZJ4_9FLAO|nr:polysaccharide pyruvyl transferase family protein [Gillisia hiemivivida]TXD95741.1 polysaccharide pyruvyl transferase family protein [Gillisia hiemivivida]
MTEIKKIHILCPEYVPLENKGEEAIIRGTIDVIYGDNSDHCEYHIVDMNSDKYVFTNGLHVHPGRLFFSDWRSREFGLGPSFEQLYSSSCSLLRNFLNKFFPFWIRNPHKEARNLKKYLSGEKKVPQKYAQSIELLREVDFIIAGHNGGLDEYVCHIVNELHTINIPFGVFGSSMKPNVNKKAILNVFHKAFESSLFNIARNPIGYRWALKHFPDLKFVLNPDPAFGMIPESHERVDQIIKENALEKLFEKPVIMVTTAEPAPISRHSFEDKVGASQKIAAHRQFLSDLLKKIHSTMDVNVLFLPHTIGPNKQMDDRLISEDVINKSGLAKDERVRLLRTDLTAKDLKGLINRADFLVAERVHSIIGAVGVCTPFLSLASDKDTRVQGMFREQMGLGDYIYSLKKPNVDQCFEKLTEMYGHKEDISQKLKDLNVRIKTELSVSGEIIEKCISFKMEERK